MEMRVELSPVTEVLKLDPIGSDIEQELASTINEAVHSAIREGSQQLGAVSGIDHVQVSQVEYDGDTYVQATVIFVQDG